MCEVKNDCERTDPPVLSTTSEAAQAEMARIGGGVWAEDKAFPRRDWRCEVANDETVLGYFDWLAIRRLEFDENGDQPLLSPTGKPIVGRVSKAFAIEYGTCSTRNGCIVFDFSGDEEIDWNRMREQAESEYFYVDADGSRWEEAQLVENHDKPAH